MSLIIVAKSQVEKQLIEDLSLDPDDWFWKEELRLARSNYVSEGVIYKSGVSGRGFWQLTPHGVLVASKLED
jgi:hypothetical protein